MRKQYKELFKRRGVPYIEHYTTAKFNTLSEEQFNSLTFMEHMWTPGDKLYKLAHEHYGSTSFWWVIANFNETPTDAHIQVGDLIYIPKPLDLYMSYIGA